MFLLFNQVNSKLADPLSYPMYLRVNNRKKTDFCFLAGKKLFFGRVNKLLPRNCFIPAIAQANYLLA